MTAFRKSPIRKAEPFTVTTSAGEIGFADDRADERRNQVFHQRGDDRAECAADDDGDGEVQDVSPKHEFLEALQHRNLPRGLYGVVAGSMFLTSEYASSAARAVCPSRLLNAAASMRGAYESRRRLRDVLSSASFT